MSGCRCDEFREPAQSFANRGEVSRTEFANLEPQRPRSGWLDSPSSQFAVCTPAANCEQSSTQTQRIPNPVHELGTITVRATYCEDLALRPTRFTKPRTLTHEPLNRCRALSGHKVFHSAALARGRSQRAQCYRRPLGPVGNRNSTNCLQSL